MKENTKLLRDTSMILGVVAFGVILGAYFLFSFIETEFFEKPQLASSGNCYTDTGPCTDKDAAQLRRLKGSQ